MREADRETEDGAVQLRELLPGICLRVTQSAGLEALTVFLQHGM